MKHLGAEVVVDDELADVMMLDVVVTMEPAICNMTVAE
jgi:hypothetical protein